LKNVISTPTEYDVDNNTIIPIEVESDSQIASTLKDLQVLEKVNEDSNKLSEQVPFPVETNTKTFISSKPQPEFESESHSKPDLPTFLDSYIENENQVPLIQIGKHEVNIRDLCNTCIQMKETKDTNKTTEYLPVHSMQLNLQVQLFPPSRKQNAFHLLSKRIVVINQMF